MGKNLGNLFLNGDGFSDKTNRHTPVNNGVVLDTVDKMFDNSSYSFTTGNYIDVPYSDDFELGTGDFTIDFWAKDLSPQYGTVIHLSSGAWGAVIGAVYNGNLAVWAASGPGSWGLLNGTVIGSQVAGEWGHYAVVRKSGQIRTFKNGIATDTVSAPGVVYNTGDSLTVGKYLDNGGSVNYWLNGNLDNVRIVKGTSLWWDNFNLDSLSLMYSADYNSDREDLLRRLYNMSSIKGNLRGKSNEGWVRPTISQFFTSKNFEEIKASYSNAELLANPVAASGSTAYVVNANEAIIAVQRSNALRTSKGMPPNSGKWYFEATLISGNPYFAVGCINNTHTASAWLYSVGIGEIISIVIDTDTGTTSYYRNGATSPGYANDQGNNEYVFPYFGIGGGFTEAICQAFFGLDDFHYPELLQTTGAKPYNTVP